MTIDSLINLLTEYRDELGPDAEVRLMTQQNWPFENRIAGLTSGAEMNDTGDDASDDGDGEEGTDDNTVYIVEGGQLRYGNKRAWQTARDC